MADVTVIIPTVGRPTLERAIASVPRTWKVDVRHDPEPGTGGMGHPQRNAAMHDATTTWLAFLDDDDAYVEDVEQLVDDGLTDRPVPHLFQMRFVNHPGFPPGYVLWKTEELRYANIGTPCFLIPNIPGRLGTWAGYDGVYGGDFKFVQETAGRMGGVHWVPQVICEVRP